MAAKTFDQTPYKLKTNEPYGEAIEGITLTTTEAGEQIEVGRGYNKRTVTIGRRIDVFLEGVKIGEVTYRMRTRERRTGQRTYVDSRWQTPGWGYSNVAPGELWPSGREIETGSLRAGVRAVAMDHARNSA